MKQSVLIFLLVMSLLAVILFSNINNSNKILGFFSQESILTYIRLEPEYSKVAAGDDILIGVRIIKLGGEGKKDVVLNLFIKKENGQLISINSQTVALETQASFIIPLNVPEELRADSYNIYLETRNLAGNELLGVATHRIIVYEGFIIYFNENNLIWIIIILFLFIVIVILLIIFVLRSRKHNNTVKHKNSFNKARRIKQI